MPQAAGEPIQEKWAAVSAPNSCAVEQRSDPVKDSRNKMSKAVSLEWLLQLRFEVAFFTNVRLKITRVPGSLEAHVHAQGCALSGRSVNRAK